MTESVATAVPAVRRLAVDDVGAALVVVPHPDDEAIGCGGMIGLLRRRGLPVFVLLLSDGEMSHPNSKKWPPAERAALRRAEFAASLAELGVEPGASQALGWPDGRLPGADDAGFADAVAAVASCLRDHPHTTLLVPWRRDPHADHRAAGAVARAANGGLPRPARVLEYLVWAPERGGAAELPQIGEVVAWRLDIGAAVDAKLRAVAAHRSQCGGVIDDDSAGFTLSASMRARCAESSETYYEGVD